MEHFEFDADGKVVKVISCCSRYSPSRSVSA